MNDGGRFDEAAGPQGYVLPELAQLMATYGVLPELLYLSLLGLLVGAAQGAIARLAARGDLEPELLALRLVAEDIDHLMQAYQASAERPR